MISSHALEGVVLSAALPESDEQPAAMRSADGQGLEWRMALDARPATDERIRLVARTAGVSYFGDAGTMFMQPGDRAKLQR